MFLLLFLSPIWKTGSTSLVTVSFQGRSESESPSCRWCCHWHDLPLSLILMKEGYGFFLIGWRISFTNWFGHCIFLWGGCPLVSVMSVHPSLTLFLNRLRQPCLLSIQSCASSVSVLVRWSRLLLFSYCLNKSFNGQLTSSRLFSEKNHEKKWWTNLIMKKKTKKQ